MSQRVTGFFAVANDESLQRINCAFAENVSPLKNSCHNLLNVSELQRAECTGEGSENDVDEFFIHRRAGGSPFGPLFVYPALNVGAKAWFQLSKIRRSQTCRFLAL